MPIKSHYTVYCIEEAATVTTWSYVLPTQCPNIHNDRTINTDLTTLINSVIDTSENIQIDIIFQPIIEPVNVLMASFLFNYEIMDDISQFVFNSHMSEGGTSYTISIYDTTHRLELGSGTFSNTFPTDNIINNLVNIPASNAELEIRCLVNGATKAFIKNITIFYHEHLFG